jgi:hypothetical protein
VRVTFDHWSWAHPVIAADHWALSLSVSFTGSVKLSKIAIVSVRMSLNDRHAVEMQE